MKVRKTQLRIRDRLGGQACVAVDLAPLAGQTPVAQVVMSLECPRHTYLDEII